MKPGVVRTHGTCSRHTGEVGFSVQFGQAISVLPQSVLFLASVFPDHFLLKGFVCYVDVVCFNCCPSCPYLSTQSWSHMHINLMEHAH